MADEKRRDIEKIVTRISRKKYIPVYLLAILILSIVIFRFIKGIPLNNNAIIIVAVFIIIMLKLTELHRLSHKYEINSDSLVHTKGILNKISRKMDFFAISDFDVSQSLWQRIMSIGNVNVRLFSKDSIMQIKDISKPFEFADFLEKMMFKKRKETNKR